MPPKACLAPAVCSADLVQHMNYHRPFSGSICGARGSPLHSQSENTAPGPDLLLWASLSPLQASVSLPIKWSQIDPGQAVRGLKRLRNATCWGMGGLARKLFPDLPFHPQPPGCGATCGAPVPDTKPTKEKRQRHHHGSIRG